MKIQRIRIEDQAGESRGFSYFYEPRLAAIEESKLRGRGLETARQEIEFDFSKAGVLALLNRYGGHPDNG